MSFETYVEDCTRCGAGLEEGLTGLGRSCTTSRMKKAKPWKSEVTPL